MIRVKIHILILLFIWCSNAYSNSWSFVKVQEDYYLQSSNGKNHQVIVESGKPSVTKIEKINEHYTKVIYFAGEAGTSQILKIYRAAVFLNKDNKFIGDFPFLYEGDDQLKQPEWSIQSNKLTIKDEHEGLEVIIELNQSH